MKENSRASAAPKPIGRHKKKQGPSLRKRVSCLHRLDFHPARAGQFSKSWDKGAKAAKYKQAFAKFPIRCQPRKSFAPPSPNLVGLSTKSIQSEPLKHGGQKKGEALSLLIYFSISWPSSDIIFFDISDVFCLVDVLTHPF